MTTWTEAAGQHLAVVKQLLGLTTELGEWAAGEDVGGPDADGFYPFTQPDGVKVLVPSPKKIARLSGSAAIYPDQFDKLAGSGPTHDDAPALQAMFNAQFLPPYPRPALRARARYYCGSTLSVDPSRNSLDGNGATIGWDLKTFLDPQAQLNLFADPDFDTGVPWIRSNNDTMPAGSVTYDGKLRFVQPDGQNKYFERGQQIICAAGDLLTLTITVDEIIPNQFGVNTFHDIVLTLRTPGATAATSIGNGAPNPDVASRLTIADNSPDYVPGKTYKWTVRPTVANPYLRMQSNASATIDSISIRIQPNNTCMLFRVPPGPQGGQLRGHNYREWRNFKLTGRANVGAFVDAVLFDSPNGDIGQHSRVQFYNVDISDNIGRGLLFQNRTYLSNFYSCRIVTLKVSVQSLGGADTGENIAFFGGNLGGGEIAVLNEYNYAFRFFGTSMDFCRQWLIGTNIILNGCWLENNSQVGEGGFQATMLAGSNQITQTAAQMRASRGQYEAGAFITGPGIPPGTTVVAKSDAARLLVLSNANTNTEDMVNEWFGFRFADLDKPLIDCQGGKITLRDTLIQQDGFTGNTRLLYPFRVATGGWLEIESMQPYNLPSRGDALCAPGGGRFTFKVKSSGPFRNITAINKRDKNHNVIGSAGEFEGNTINCPVWLANGSTQQRVDRYSISQRGTGSFVANVVQGSNLIYGLAAAPNGQWRGRELLDNDVRGATVADYQIASTGFSGNTAIGSNVITNVSPPPTGQNALEKFVSGPGIPHGTRILAYSNGSRTLTLDRMITASATGITVSCPHVLIMSQPLNRPTVENTSLRYADNNTDRAIARISSDIVPYSGSKCLEIYKNLPSSAALTAYLALPCEPNRAFSSELRWAVPPVAGSTLSASVFFNPFLANIPDVEADYPQFQDTQEITDLPKTNIPLATGTDGWVDRAPYAADTGMWRRLTASINSNGLGRTDGYTPEWANYLVWKISLISMPRGGSLLIDGLIGNNQ